MVKNRGFHLIILLVLSILMIFFSDRAFMARINRVGFEGISSIQDYFGIVGEYRKQLLLSKKERKQMEKEYLSLQKRMEELSLMQINYASLDSENKRLRNMLDYAEKIDAETLPATVIGKNPQNYRENFTIDRGIEHGILKNMVVVGFQNGEIGLAGRIITVGIKSSLVIPLQSKDFFVAARLKNVRYEGLVSSLENDPQFLRLGYVSKNAVNDVKTGDQVITSGLNSYYPPNLLIGTVQSVENSDREEELQIVVDPFIDISLLETVFVIFEGVIR